MTLKELEQSKAIDLSINSWLREACIQLALINLALNVAQLSEKKGPGRPPAK